MSRRGVQTEIMASLALVMVLATLMLSALWIARHESSLRTLLGRSLVREARVHRGDSLFPGTDWWVRSADGTLRPRGGVREPVDAETTALAERVAVGGQALLQPGPVWREIRFAAPIGGGEVAVARLPREASFRLRAAPLIVGALVLGLDALVFTLFGAVLLRRRVVQPLQALAAAARARAEGDTSVRALEVGSGEAVEVARAFNHMTDTLESQSDALRKAVVDLRGANEELRQARDGLDRAERLAAVGHLAAGVAHEVGNPMGAILAFLDLAGRDEGCSEATRGHLERAAREGERVRVILRQLLDFSLPSRGSPAPLDVVREAGECVALVSAQRRYAGVEFDVVGEGAAPLAFADPGAVAQILLNLCLNAGDAVAGAEPARVKLLVRPAALRLRDGDSAPPPPRRHPDAVECVVADTGSGIAPEDRERVFDPFFTTKPPGEGTGLGLANSSRLAEEQGGSLELVEPPEGFGTAFVVRLPVSAAPEGAGATPQGPADPAVDCAARRASDSRG